MTNILTAAEAANVLRCLTTDALMLQLLPQVDDYIKTATGRDWTADSSIYPKAKAAAQMLLAMWHENPSMTGNAGALQGGLSACLTQLEAQALELESSGVPDAALTITARLPKDGDTDIAITANLTLIFSHAMDSSATSAVVLKNAAGSTVTTVNILDVTKKILTVNPTGSLTSDAAYTLVITAAADNYGRTITDEIGFTTA
jgi:methionine-rich copper-binding protein CopC